MKKEIDWMGRWYDIIRERGENDRPVFGKLDLINHQVDWMNFSHSEMDGVGAMIDYYEKTDFRLTKYPVLREKAAPTLFERILIFIRLFFFTKKLKTEWIECNPGIEPNDSQLVSYKVLTIEETKKLETFCKKNHFSTNAFLMNHSSKFLLDRLSKNHQGTWTLPVNLRPVLKKQNIKSNHSSGILINYQQTDSAMDTHLKISKALKQKQHWGIWWIHQIGKYIGFEGMRFISNQNAKKSFIMGSFSNLSTWELPPNQIWVGGAPGSKNFPITVMIMKANDQMSYSLKIHPYILKDQLQIPVILEQLIKSLLTAVD